MGEFDYYWQVGAAHQAESFSSATAVNAYAQPAWTQFDASAGLSKGNWSVEFVGSNLTDLNKSLLTGASQFILTETVQRPRTLGVRIGYKFSE
jgi:outer membrane receptor protein involved in Fe transport